MGKISVFVGVSVPCRDLNSYNIWTQKHGRLILNGRVWADVTSNPFTLIKLLHTYQPPSLSSNPFTHIKRFHTHQTPSSWSDPSVQSINSVCEAPPPGPMNRGLYVAVSGVAPLTSRRCHSLSFPWERGRGQQETHDLTKGEFSLMSDAWIYCGLDKDAVKAAKAWLRPHAAFNMDETWGSGRRFQTTTHNSTLRNQKDKGWKLTRPGSNLTRVLI